MSVREARTYTFICDRCKSEAVGSDPLTVSDGWVAWSDTDRLRHGHFCPRCLASFRDWIAEGAPK